MENSEFSLESLSPGSDLPDSKNVVILDGLQYMSMLTYGLLLHLLLFVRPGLCFEIASARGNHWPDSFSIISSSSITILFVCFLRQFH